MKKIVVLLSCFTLFSLVACKPTSQEDNIPMRSFELNNEMQTILEDEEILQMKYIHGDVVVVYGEYIEDGQGFHVVRYDEEDGIILDVTYPSSIIKLREEADNALYIKSGTTFEHQIDIYEEDGSVIASAENVILFTNYETQHLFIADIYRNPVDNLYYGVMEEYIEINSFNVFITQFNGLEQKTVYQMQLIKDSSITPYETYLLTDGSFLLQYIPSENSSVTRVQQVTVDGTILFEEDFMNTVTVDLLQDGYILHSNSSIKRYSNNASLTWELNNINEYKGVIGETNNSIQIHDGNQYLTIDASGTVVRTSNQLVDVGYYTSTLDNGYDAYINYDSNSITIMDDDSIVDTYTTDDLYKAWVFPSILIVASGDPDGIHITQLNQDLSIDFEYILPIDTTIFQVFENRDMLINTNNTLEYRNRDGSIKWSWQEDIYVAKCYSAVTDYIVIEYFEDQDMNSMSESDRKIAILSLDGELLSSYTFGGFSRYASFNSDYVIIQFIPYGETRENSEIVYLGYESESIISHDRIYDDMQEYWYIHEGTLYVVRHILFED